MSESSNLKKSFQSIPPTNYSSTIEIEQLSIHSKKILSLSEETIDSKSADQKLQKKITDVFKNNETIGDCESVAKKHVRHEYPLTKWSKRKRTAKIRTERDRKFENIKRFNETITRGAETIKVYFISIEVCRLTLIRSILYHMINVFYFRIPRVKHTSTNYINLKN